MEAAAVLPIPSSCMLMIALSAGLEKIIFSKKIENISLIN